MFEQMRFGQGFQHTQNLGTFLQCAACQLTDNKRMAKDLLIKEQSFQTFATRSEMLNPNQSVDQNHARLRGRRLRIRRSCFSVPPRFAKRRALSLAIRASSPRRTNEIFSFTPVSLAASCSLAESGARQSLRHPGDRIAESSLRARCRFLRWRFRRAPSIQHNVGDVELRPSSPTLRRTAPG